MDRNAPRPADVAPTHFRFGRAPERWSEACLALSMTALLFAFAVLAIGLTAWPRTEVAGIEPADQPNMPRAATYRSQSSAPASDPLWPAPPPGRDAPPADAPNVAPRRITTEPAIRALTIRERDGAR